MFSGSDIQRALGRNPKAGNVAGDENAVSMATKSKSLKNFSLGDGDSRKAALSTSTTHKPAILGESKRGIMVDKSNYHDYNLAATTNNKDTALTSRQLQQPSETAHTQHKSVSSTTTNTTTAAATRLLNQQTTRQEAAAAEAATEAETLKDFFEDNKRRYKSTTPQGDEKKKMEPTPVLPISVPDRMKPSLREKYLSSNSSSKRSSEGMYQRSERLLSSLKRQKYLDQLANDDHKSSTQGKENVDPNASSQAATKLTSSSSLRSHPPPLPPKSSLPSPSQSASTHHTTKPSFSAIESKDFQHAELSVDQQTYDEANKQEQLDDQRAQQNLLQNNQVSQTSDNTNDESNDPMLVAEYADEILNYLRETESDTLVDPGYISIQHEVTWRMRDVLIDWVIEVHYIFQLLPETLFLTVNIIDRFLSRRDVSMGKLQLVGIASLFVATKFEETISPPVKQYLFVTGDMVTEEELLKSERYILQILDFKLCYPNPFHFLRKSTMTGNFDVHIRFLAKYFMEITLIDHRFLGTPPSQVAASSLWLAIKILCKGGWTPELVMASGYTVQEVKPTVELILDYLSQPINDKSFYKKWSSRRMMKVSAFVRNWVQRFYG
ncbi:unnamed protein product [Absidia cylindrospora]